MIRYAVVLENNGLRVPYFELCGGCALLVGENRLG